MTAQFFAEGTAREASGSLDRQGVQGQEAPEQRLLAAVTASKDSQQIVRWVRKLAGRLRSPWIVLYVETSRVMDSAQQSQLAENLALARELGAEVITTTGNNVVASILRVAAQRNITQIVVGKSVSGTWWNRLGSDLTLRQLIRDSGDIEIHAVPAERNASAAPLGRLDSRAWSIWPQYLLAVGVVAAVTLTAFVFTPLVGAHATALVFLLAVVLLALIVERGPTLVAAALSAVCWEFFFLPPIYAFSITHFEDAMLFGMYFVVALVLGQLTARIRAQEEAERRREGRATALYLLTRELNKAPNLDQLVQKAVQQMGSTFEAQVAVLLPDSHNRLRAHSAGTFQLTESDQEVPAWVVQHCQPAGRFTDNLRDAEALYLPLATTSGPVAVIGLHLRQAFALTIQQQALLEAFLQQIALSVDRLRLNEISEKAKLLSESERLSKTLLDSMSHEIRTPIAAIQSATGNLAERPELPLSAFQREMIAEIEEATKRLNRLVGNVLEMSRLESGTIRPRLNECDVRELVHVAVAETEKQLERHKVTVLLASGLPLVRMDFVLMQQVLTNLLSNAASHTPSGTEIVVSARVQVETLVVAVADRGPGIPAESLGRVFDKFYRAPNAPTGGTGLGLSLVKGFVEAHGGQVKAENCSVGGALFTICLPLARTTDATLVNP